MLKRAIIVALFGFFAGLAMLFAGYAGADAHILVGGNTDCTSQGLLETKAAQGDLHGTPVPIVYGTCDGDFAPFLGSTTPADAIAQGIAATRQAWDEHCANTVQRCTLEGFSDGDGPVSVVGNDVGADRPGSNTHVVTNGNAWGDTGVFGPTPGVIGSFIKLAAPVIGVPVNLAPVPNSENRNDVNDGWGSNGGQNIVGEIAQLSTINGGNGLPPQHNVPSGVPSGSYVDENGVDNKFYGSPLPGVVAPQNNPVDNPPAVRLDAPEFFGELPCADGKFTPGDSAC